MAAAEVRDARGLDIESGFGAIGQHKSDGAIVDPNQFGQTHGIQAGDIGYRCGGIALDASRL